MNARIRISLSSASVWISASNCSRSSWITSPGSVTRSRASAERRPLIMLPRRRIARCDGSRSASRRFARSDRLDFAADDRQRTGHALSPTSTSTSPRVVDRRRPCAAIRAT